MSGTLSATGGGIFNNVLGITRNWRPFTLIESPSILWIEDEVTGRNVNRAFLLATLYFCLVSGKVENLIVPREEGRVYITFFTIFTYSMQKVNPHFDIFQYISMGLRAVFNIPAEIPPL